jgi:hypothetical protein
MRTIDFKPSMLASFILMISLSATIAQDLAGAWRLVNKNGKTVTEDIIRIHSGNYFMFGMRGADGTFKGAEGGSYELSGTKYIETPDFSTIDSSQVRKTRTYSFTRNNEEFTTSTSGQTETWKKIDSESTALSGTWRFGARVGDDGSIGERRAADSPRQTVKILSGKHFQWAAFNFETREFFGTGGGTYQLKDNQYTETIRFFSRDNSRVGMSLTFECKLDGNDWFHKGKGTTGNPVSEVWERGSLPVPGNR